MGKDMKKRDKAMLLILLACLAAFVLVPSKDIHAKQSSKYTIAYNANGGKGTMKSTTCIRGKTYKLRKNTFTRKGYVFLKWNTKKNGKGKSYSNLAKIKNIASKNKKKITLYAIWGKKITVKFNANGGSVKQAKKTVTQSKKYGTLPKASRKGYTFKGWYTKKSGGKKVSAKTIVNTSKNQVLYAQWNTNKYNITYNTNEGINHEKNRSVYTITTKTFNLYTPKRTGYTFAAWHKNNLNGSIIKQISKGSVGNLVLYAEWIPTNYNITYHLSDGKNNDGNPLSYRITSETKALLNPTKEGFEFKGWYKDSSFSQQVTEITKGSYGDLILWAKWEEIPVTRIEWITQLVKTMQYDIQPANFLVDDDGNIRYSFDDIHMLENPLIVEAAVANGLLEVPVDEDDGAVYFNPNEIATREFVAATTVKALGFTDTKAPQCNDSNELKYPNEVAIAINQGVFALENGNFNPETKIVYKDTTRIVNFLNSILQSEEIVEEKDNIQYAEDVIAEQIKTIEDYSVVQDDDNFILEIINTDVIEGTEVGDILFLSPNQEHPTGFALKIVQDISETEERRKFVCTKPDHISNLITEVDIEGYGEAIPGLIEGADGVEVSYDPNGVIEEDTSFSANSSRINTGGTIALPGTISFQLDNKKLTENIELNGSIEMAIPSISYRVDADFGLINTRIDELYFAVTQESSIKADISVTGIESLIDEEGGEIEIGRVPFALGASGFSIDVGVWLTYSISGEASITYTIESTQGIQYINGNMRVIKDSSSNLELVAKGAFEAGPRLSVILTFGKVFDLLDISGDVGIGGEVKVTARIDGPTCSDLTTYLYLRISAGGNSIIGEILGIEYTWDIYNADNSILKKNFHFENWHRIPECSYGKGIINGVVIKADERSPIENATIKFYDQDNNLFKKVYTDMSGKYSTNLDIGNYRMVISAKGFMSFQDSCEIDSGIELYKEASMMVDNTGEWEATGYVSGVIIDSVTGDLIQEAALNVRKGWNNKSNEILLTSATNSLGEYAFELPYGNYTVELIKEGYITGYINIISQVNSTTNQNGDLTPALDENNDKLRVVLSWGEQPYDLDAHIFGPTIGGYGRFHVYFGKKYYADYIDGSYETLVNLDRDDLNSYGPETITLKEGNNSGVYSYYVQDYSNRYSSDSNMLSLSNAKVKIYVNGQLRNTFSVPYNIDGTVWHVFNYDYASNNIVPVNTMSDTMDASGYASNGSQSADDSSDLEMLIYDLIEK